MLSLINKALCKIYAKQLMKRLGFFFLLMFFALSGVACKKNDQNTLPPITQSGKNTFGCYVDGQLWLPSKSYSITARVLCITLDKDASFHLLVKHDHPGYDPHDYFSIVFKPLTTTGTYDLSDQSKAGSELEIQGESNYSDTYKVVKGQLIITRFDNIVAGQFSFSIINNRTNKIYNITEGRFDLKSDYCF
jgi:hypothetical protein